MNYTNDTNYAYSSNRVSAVLRRVYVNMTLGLIVTAIVAMFCAGSQAYLDFMAEHSWAFLALVIAEFGIVIGVSAGINRLSSPAAVGLFYLFALVNGMLLSKIFMAYTDTSIAKTFLITSVTFAAMSIYGFFTNQDLTRFGSLLFMALIGLIIASVINIFTHSRTFEWIISGAGVLIFVGLTAWDTQQIKRMAYAMPEAGLWRLAALGALSLYLDFINLFLYLLRFFGNSRD